MFRNLVWIAKAVISGFEQNLVEGSVVNGVGSCFMLQELIHTHFWDQHDAITNETNQSVISGTTDVNLTVSEMIFSFLLRYI